MDKVHMVRGGSRGPVGITERVPLITIGPRGQQATRGERAPSGQIGPGRQVAPGDIMARGTAGMHILFDVEGVWVIFLEFFSLSPEMMEHLQ